jgi:hypothetical protein
MHGDFTRDTFDRKRHYSSVRQQQGRVQLDADFNEQADISLYLERTANRDQIGAMGVPYADPVEFVHFKIRGNSLPALEVAPGRIYVDGMLIENDASPAAALNKQPHLPEGAAIVEVGDTLSTLANAPAGKYAIYLQVAEAHVTAVEEPSLREVALNGPDTTTRMRTVWQVRLRQTAANDNCVSAQSLLPRPSRGRLTTSEKPVAGPDDPCAPGGGGGYLGVENQLYRVEIHSGGALGAATFKWSRENGSVVVAVEDFIPEQAPPNDCFKVEVESLGRDAVLGLAKDDWVELIDERTEQLGQTGTLAQIVDIGTALDGGYVIELSQDVKSHIPPGNNPLLLRPRLRRWDQAKNLEADGSIKTAGGPIELEDGVLVEFTVDPAGNGPHFRTGDYWFFAARAATGKVERLNAAPARGAMRYALLAMATVSSSGSLAIDDCRPQFPAATDLVHLLYVGGDGQQGPGGQPLPAPLQVSVSRGRFPVPGARVRFSPGSNSGNVNPPEAVTDANGVASCTWTLSSGTPLQTVEARLLLPNNTPAPNPPVRFSAAIAVPGGGSACCCASVGPDGDFATLDDAIRGLLEKGERHLCLCLMADPEGHDFSGLTLEHAFDESELHIHISGCGPGSLIRLHEPLRLRGVTSFHLEEVAIQTTFEVEGPQGALAFDECEEISIANCQIAGITAMGDLTSGGVLLSIANTSSVRLRDLHLEARMHESFEVLIRTFQEVGIDVLVAAIQAAQEDEKIFREKLVDIGQALARLNPEEGKNLAAQLRSLTRGGGFSAAEHLNFQKLAFAVSTERTKPDEFEAILHDFRRAAIKARPGTALVLGTLPDVESLEEIAFSQVDRDNFISIESCQIAGEIGLYGLPLTPKGFGVFMPLDRLKQLQAQMREGRFLLGDGSLPLGTLELRGNQLLRMAIAEPVATVLSQQFDTSRVIGFFNEVLLTDNVFESEPNILAAMHCGLSGNQFQSQQRTRFTAVSGGVGGVIVAQSGVYVGNRGEGQSYMEITQFPGNAANVRITFS